VCVKHTLNRTLPFFMLMKNGVKNLIIFLTNCTTRRWVLLLCASTVSSFDNSHFVRRDQIDPCFPIDAHLSHTSHLYYIWSTLTPITYARGLWMKLQECLRVTYVELFRACEFLHQPTRTCRTRIRFVTWADVIIVEATYKELNSSMNGAIITFYIFFFYIRLLSRVRGEYFN